jgi:hypothetical protein
MEVSGKLLAMVSLPMGKEPLVGLKAGLDIFGEEGNVLPLPGIKPQIIQPIA